jgi:O-acetyl-ADP-ribose deacetylase (regulator of RNase III)
MTDIKIIQGNITKMKADAIVNAANNSLLGGGGVDGAIHAAAGPHLLEECMTLHGCHTGDAKIALGYDLPAKHVIHTVGPVYSGKSSDCDMLRACYRNSLDLAKKADLHSIIFPAISTGAFGFPAKIAAEIAYDTIAEWQKENSKYKMQVALCAYDDRMYQLYKQVAA